LLILPSGEERGRLVEKKVFGLTNENRKRQCGSFRNYRKADPGWKSQKSAEGEGTVVERLGENSGWGIIQNERRIDKIEQ